MPDTDSCYEAVHDQTSLYQGDVLTDIPLVYMPPKISKWMILRPNLKGAMSIDDVLGGQIPKWFEAHPQGQVQNCWQHGDREEFVAAKAKKMMVMILTQTCDLVQRTMYQVAPVFIASEHVSENKLGNLRQNEFQYLYYLPPNTPGLPNESFADLSQITGVTRYYFQPQAVVARLTRTATRHFQSHVAEYFGRPFGFNVRDRAPLTAEYACVRCFYEHFRLQKKPVEAGQHFPECNLCGDGLWERISAGVQADIKFPPTVNPT